MKNLTYQEDEQTDISLDDRIEMSTETEMKWAI